MEPRTLKNVAAATEGQLLNGSPEQTVARISTDSRHVQAGDLFFALAGERFDGHAFLPDAVRARVVAVVVEEGRIPPEGFMAASRSVILPGERFHCGGHGSDRPTS